MHHKLNNYIFAWFLLKTHGEGSGKRADDILLNHLIRFESEFNERIVLIEKELMTDGFIFIDAPNHMEDNA